MKHLIIVAAGGALGASSRYAVGALMTRLAGAGFPWGTLVANVIGCFLMGVLIEGLALRFEASPALRHFLTTGVLGGFTTFSAFALDTVVLWERKQAMASALYLSASVIGCIVALILGLMLARTVFEAGGLQ